MLLRGFIAAELAAAVAWAASNVTSIEQGVVLLGLVLVALATIWKTLRWMGRGALKANHAYSVLLRVDERLDRQDERLAVVEGALDVIKDKEANGITELIHRGPPGRRGTDIAPQ